MFGISRGTGLAHIARATLDSIVQQVADVAEAMTDDLGRAPSIMRVDGGAASNNALLQDQADILGTAVERPVVTETTALGAAGLAGLAVGYWKDQAEIGANWAIDRRFEPTMDDAERLKRRRRWAKAVDRVRGWAAEP